MKQGIKNSLFTIGASALFSCTTQAADFSAGGAIGTNGLGAYVSITPDWSLGNGEIQFRITGGSTSSSDSETTFETTFESVDYKGSLDFSGVQMGLDWYPSANGQFFISGGVADFDRKFDVTNKADANFKVGNQQVTPTDNVSLNADVNHSDTAPYLSIGWGNRHKGSNGLSFMIEIGAIFPSDDPNVDLTVTGNTKLISTANLDQHKQDIKDDLNTVQPMALIGIGYHF